MKDLPFPEALEVFETWLAGLDLDEAFEVGKRAYTALEYKRKIENDLRNGIHKEAR